MVPYIVRFNVFDKPFKKSNGCIMFESNFQNKSFISQSYYKLGSTGGIMLLGCLQSRKTL